MIHACMRRWDDKYPKGDINQSVRDYLAYECPFILDLRELFESLLESRSSYRGVVFLRSALEAVRSKLNAALDFAEVIVASKIIHGKLLSQEGLV